MAFVGIGYLLELETPEKSYTRNPDVLVIADICDLFDDY